VAGHVRSHRHDQRPEGDTDQGHVRYREYDIARDHDSPGEQTIELVAAIGSLLPNCPALIVVLLVTTTTVRADHPPQQTVR
jgi:hypothetical protein